MTSTHPKLTLWSNPFLLSPLRLEIYLREKQLPTEANFTRVNADFGPPPTFSWVVPVGAPATPEGTLPALLIEPTDPAQPSQLIHESGAIMEYLEDAFPENPLRGETLLERARVRAVLSICGELNRIAGTWALNSSPLTSARMPHGQIEATSKWSIEQEELFIGRLESWMLKWREQCHDKAGWAAATKRPTLGDFALWSHVVFFRDFYGWDMLEGHTELNAWMKRMEARDSAFVDGQPPQMFLDMAKLRVEY